MVCVALYHGKSQLTKPCGESGFIFFPKHPQHNSKDTFVQFPLDLDLAPFVVGPSSTSAQYRLYAVVNHSGTLTCGHYTAYCDLVVFEDTARKKPVRKGDEVILFIVGWAMGIPHAGDWSSECSPKAFRFGNYCDLPRWNLLRVGFFHGSMGVSKKTPLEVVWCHVVTYNC